MADSIAFDTILQIVSIGKVWNQMVSRDVKLDRIEVLNQQHGHRERRLIPNVCRFTQRLCCRRAMDRDHLKCLISVAIIC